MSKVLNLSNTTKSHIKLIKEAADSFATNLVGLQEFIAGFDEMLDKKATIEAEIEEAKIRTDEAVRAAEVDMNLRIKANKEVAIQTLAKELGSKVLTEKEYKELYSKAVQTEEAINVLVDEAKAAGKRQLEAALKSQGLEHKAATAELTAKVNALNETLANKNQEIDQLRGQIQELNEVLKVASSKGSVTQTIGKV